MSSYTVATHIGTRDQSPQEIITEMARVQAAFTQVRMEKVEVTPAELAELRRFVRQLNPDADPDLTTRGFSLLGVPVVLKG